MRRPLRIALVALAAVAIVGALAALAQASPGTSAPPLERRDLLVGLLVLGVLALAAYGFDLRDHF